MRIAPSVWGDMKRLVCWRPTQYQVKSFGVGCTMICVNVAILTVLTGWWGITPIVANVLRMPFANQVRFVLCRYIVWRDRREDVWWQQWLRFQGLKVGLTVLQQGMFVVLTRFVGWNYLVVYGGLAVMLGLFSFRLNHKKVFQAPTTVVQGTDRIR